MLLLQFSCFVFCVMREPLASVNAAVPFEVYTGGSRPSDYIYNVYKYDPSFISAQIIAGSSASTGPGDYGAFFYTLDASQIRGHRVMLEARVFPFDVVKGAWAGVFLRVNTLDGRVLAFDNMIDRPVSSSHRQVGGTLAQVVVQVPEIRVEEAEACPDPSSLAATIVVGMFLCGGRGTVRFDGPEFQRVADDHPLTGVTAPWSGPGLNDLGPGTLWRPGRSFRPRT